jgi:HNH endonuclease
MGTDKLEGRPSIPQVTRRTVFVRAAWLCEYCRSPEDIGTVSFQVEHIHPYSQGGSSELDNLASSCPGCNSHKAIRTHAMDAATGVLVPLFHPRKQLWEEHFVWNADFTQMIGLTPTGRATIDALLLNRQRLQNLRRVLREDGLHPPNISSTT